METKADSKSPALSGPTSAFLQTLRRIGECAERKCRSHGRYLSPVFLAYLARMIDIQENDNMEGRPLLESDEEKLVELTVSRVLSNALNESSNVIDDAAISAAAATASDKDLQFETMRLQAVFENVFDQELRKVAALRTKSEADKKAALEKLLVIATSLQTNEQVAQLYRGLFKLLLAHGCTETAPNSLEQKLNSEQLQASGTGILKDGVESKLQRNIEREVAAALESTFPQVALTAFTLLSSEDKLKQLADLVPICLGIRLFNRELNKGGVGIPDVPRLALQENERLMRLLQSETQAQTSICIQYATLLNLEYQKPGTIASSVRRLQSEITHKRQLLLLLQQLQHECIASMETINSYKVTLANELMELKVVVGTKSTVPKDQVYPKFKNLSVLWHSLIAQQQTTTVRSTVFTELTRFGTTSAVAASQTRALPAHDVLLLDMHKKQQQQKGAASPTHSADDDYSFVPTASLYQLPQLGDTPPSLLRILPDESVEFLSIVLEHQGFCPWTLSKRGGLLLPGNPVLGVVRFADQSTGDVHFYSFATVDAMREFCADPTKWRDGVRRALQRSPELVYLLSAQQQVPYCDVAEITRSFWVGEPSAASSAAARGDQGQFSVKSDACIGTEDSYVGGGIDPNYEWNEWKLRQKAIQMANIMDKRTHSTQTAESHFRRENTTQTYVKQLDKDGSMPGTNCQMGVEIGTNTAKVTRYLGGLRGGLKSETKVITLSLEPDVWHASNPPVAFGASKHAASVAVGSKLKAKAGR